jgi:hypothetical protein
VKKESRHPLLHAPVVTPHCDCHQLRFKLLLHPTGRLLVTAPTGEAILDRAVTVAAIAIVLVPIITRFSHRTLAISTGTSNHDCSSVPIHAP